MADVNVAVGSKLLIKKNITKGNWRKNTLLKPTMKLPLILTSFHINESLLLWLILKLTFNYLIAVNPL